MEASLLCNHRSRIRANEEEMAMGAREERLSPGSEGGFVDGSM